MLQQILSFSSQDQIRTLFGCRDENLRLVRDRLGVQIVVRGEELKLSGNLQQVETGRRVFTELQAIVEKHGELFPAEVERIVSRHSDGTTLTVAGRTRSSVDDRVDSSTSRRPNGRSNGESSVGSNGNSGTASAINLFEKARTIEPRTQGQARYVDAIRENDLVFCLGPAGCGKTYLAVAMALNALRTERVRKIVLVRPAVEAGEKLGFLPGDMLAKVNPYLRPLLDALADIVSFEQVKRYMENDVIEILPLAFMRGRTLNDTFIILDEAQNTTSTQMMMFLTRMGENSKIVVTGDPTQTDLPNQTRSGLTDAVPRLRHISGVEAVTLTGQDIVRHPLVREIVRAYDSGQPKPGRVHSRRK